MLGFARWGVKANGVLLGLLVVFAAGCFWRQYPDRIAMHVDVLVGIGRKGVDLVVGRRFTAESFPELTYPLERATAYAASVRDHGPTLPPSFAAFEELLAKYRALVDTIDRTRRSPVGPEGAAELAAALEDVEKAAAEVRARLGVEAGGGH